MNTEHKSCGAYWRWSNAFYTFLRLMGQMPFELDKEKEKLVPSVKSWAWALFVFTTQMSVLLISSLSRMWNVTRWDTYGELLENMVVLFGAGKGLQFVTTWYSMSRVSCYVRDWREFEEQFRNVTCKHCPTFKPWMVISHMLFLATMTLLLLFVQTYYSVSTTQWSATITYVIISFNSKIITIFWVLNCIFIAQTAKRIKHYLINMLSSSPDPQVVRDYRLIWLRQLHLISGLTDAFGPTIAIQLLLNFITFLLSLYMLIVATVERRPHIIAVYGSLGLRKFFSLMSVCESCHYVSVEVGRKPLLEILSIKTQAMSFDTKKEVELLIAAIARNPATMEVVQCVNLGRDVAVKMATTILTYLVVLVQFDAVSD